jgi:capsular exopolysaccharide synthesis family protein
MRERGDANPLLEYWAVLVRRRWVIYLVASAATVIALVGSFLSTPLYRATATLQVERQNPDILTFRDLSRTDYSWAAYTDFYQTQYKILASEAVARRAVDRLGLTSHPLFDGSPRRPGVLSRLKGLVPHRAPVAPLDPEDAATATILGALEISPVRDSQLIKVSWIAREPQLAAQVANAVVDAYIQFNMESQYTTSDQATEFLVDQIGQLKREIAAIEKRLQDYGESKRIVSIDDSNNITFRALADIAQRRTAAQTELAQKEAAYRALTSSPPEALPEVLHSTLISRLKEEYAAYEAEFSEKSRQFKDGWPGMQTLKSKLEQAGERLDLETQRISRQVALAAEAEYHKALHEVRNLDALLQQHEEAAQRLKRDAVEFANLQSEVNKKRETLNTLIARQNEMALSTRLKDLDETSSNIRIVDRARPPVAPFRPDVRLNVVLALVLGLGLGVGLALFQDYLDNTIATPGQLGALVPLPVLAVIPRHGSPAAPFARVRRRRSDDADPTDLITHRDGRAGAAEAYRSLRTAILLSSPGGAPRRIMITSALPDEGKSLTALNLAVVLAQLGRRVLAVDTDLRRPRLHRPFNLDNRQGVTTYLSGLEPSSVPLVLPTGVDCLDLLPSGPVPPNPSELLNSAMFSKLIAWLLDSGYDHIVFDSPPALSVADPVIIGSAVDASILVVRAESTPKQSIRHAVDRFAQSGVRPIGAVLNDASLEGQPYTYYYYYRHRDSGERARAAGR